MPEMDWAVAMGTLITAMITALGLRAFVAGGRTKADPVDALRVVMSENVRVMQDQVGLFQRNMTLFEALNSMMGQVGNDLRAIEHNTSKLIDIQQAIQLENARNNRGGGQ